MQVSDNSFEGSSSGDEESVEESSEEEVPMSKSEIPFDKKVQMFNNGGKAKSSSESDEAFDDESGSESGSGSEYSESDSDESSGSEGDFYEEPRRGMGSISSNNSRRWFFLGIACFCIVCLGLSIGLGVGLTRGKKDKEMEADLDNDVDPTFKPTNAPVRLPIKLPNPPNPRLPFVTEDANIEVEGNEATTIYRDGELAETNNGQNATLLVQGGDPENPDLPSAYSLIELAVPVDEFSNLLRESSESATFCLEHVPDETLPDRKITYSGCLIGFGAPDQGVESLTGLDANYNMPDDCVGEMVVNFDVSPTDTLVCMDVTDMVFDMMSNRRALRNLRGRRLDESTNIETEVLLMMIENLEPSDQAGDRFYNDGDKTPSLTIEGTKAQECATIADVICSDDKFSLLCSLSEAAGLEEILGDNLGTFTVFAPTDAAIQKLLSTGVDTSDVNFLEHLLRTHVVYLTEIESSDIDCTRSELPPLRMSNGENTFVTCDSDSIFIAGAGNTGENGFPKIVEVDIETCNGIVHAIDNVIIPEAQISSKEEESGDETTDGTTDETSNETSNETADEPVADEVTPSADGDCQSVADVLCSHPELAALCSFSQLFATDPSVSQIFETLSSEEGTLFLPNNIAAAGLAGLVGNMELVAALLSNHFAPGEKLEADDLVCDSELAMAGGASTTTRCVDDEKFQVGTFNTDPLPKITVSNIETCTVIIHVIDQVLQTVQQV